MFLLANRQVLLFIILAYILPNLLSFQVVMSKNFFLHNFLNLIVGLWFMLYVTFWELLKTMKICSGVQMWIHIHPFVGFSDL